MSQKKGQTGNPNGRPIGSKNRTTTEIKLLINQFISGNLDELQANYDKLEPRDKLTFFRDLLKFVVPVKSESKTEVTQMYPELTPEETKARILQLKKELGIPITEHNGTN